MNFYLCLRNCFVDGRFFTKGQTYRLEEKQVNSPKNFKQVKGEQGEETPKEKTPSPQSFICDFPGCGKDCKSAIGLISHKRSHKPKEEPSADSSG